MKQYANIYSANYMYNVYDNVADQLLCWLFISTQAGSTRAWQVGTRAWQVGTRSWP